MWSKICDILRSPKFNYRFYKNHPLAPLWIRQSQPNLDPHILFLSCTLMLLIYIEVSQTVSSVQNLPSIPFYLFYAVACTASSASLSWLSSRYRTLHTNFETKFYKFCFFHFIFASISFWHFCFVAAFNFYSC